MGRHPLAFFTLFLVALAPLTSEAKTETASWRVPILMYHYIAPISSTTAESTRTLTVRPEKFAKNLDWLRENGYTPVTFKDIASGKLPEKPIMLTFDDGYNDAYANAFPALRTNGMKGVFYIITGRVGKPGYLTWDQIREMQKAGMEIAAHTVSHLDLRSLSGQRLQSELIESFQTILQETGSIPTSLAYPAGRYSAAAVKVLKNAGVRYAVTTKHGVATNSMVGLELPRLRMTDSTALWGLPLAPKGY